MNILSLFDGMACGRIALERSGVKVDKYFASEIDKYAIKVSKANYHDIIQLGDVTKVDWFGLPRIDLLIGGSPCQGFSFAGKQLNFNDPRSALFFEYVRILNELKPKYFMLENVRMKKEYQDIISEHLGVQPVMINSALVSAQNRVRLYWVGRLNDDGHYEQVEIPQPQDKRIILKQIIEGNENFINHYSTKATNKINRVANVNPSGKGMNGEVYSVVGKAPTLTTNKGEGIKITGGAMRGRYLDENGQRLDSTVDSQSGLTEQRIEVRDDGKSNCLTSVQKDSLCIQIDEADLKGKDQIKRVYSPEGKSPTLTTMQGGHQEPKISQDNITWRKLTPLECERLQTVPDNYTAYVSNSQRYKMLGNGWTVDVISHIFKSMWLHNV